MAIYGNIVGGNNGGDMLDLTVVPGTTQPTDPKENTIWANSSYTMGSWDISPTEPHRVSRTRNLIVYPYLYATRTNSGVTMTVDDTTSNRGVVTINGTNTSSGSIALRLSNSGIENREILLQPGTYFLSGNCESSSSSTHRLTLVYSYNNWVNTTTVYDNGSGKKFTIDKVAKARVGIQVQGGVTVTNAVYKPQLEKGSSATSYVMGNATGQIWVKTAPGSTVLMDAAKGKNSINVQPSAVYEYTTNNGWVKRNAQVYQYGVWTEFNSFGGYYYNAGSLCESVTGGWATTGWTSTTHNINQLSAINTDHLYVVASSNALSAVGTINKVDISSVSKIKASVEITSPGRVVLCICDTYAPQSGVASSFVTTNGTHEISLDVSGFNGSYYIIIYAESLSSQIPEAKITSVWGE